ncbi:MAG: 5'-3' exonuclease H3TH domain-containing protein [Candidatus Paceibacterota bacterium]
MATKIVLPGNFKGNLALILDGTNLLHRSYHGMRGSDLRSGGKPVWGLHGFGSTLNRLITEVRPVKIITAFDLPGGAPQRRLVAPEYKGNRSKPDEDLRYQLQECLALCSEAGLGATTAEGWEADDVIASAVKVGRELGYFSAVVSSDRDCYQLISDTSIVIKPEGVIYDKEKLMNEVGVTPEGYRHLAALRGEPSDNLLGVNGIGVKTAAKLLSVYLDPDLMLRERDKVEVLIGRAAAAKLFNGFDIYRRNLEVGELKSDLPVKDSFNSVIDAKRVADAFMSYGLSSVSQKLSKSISSLGSKGLF